MAGVFQKTTITNASDDSGTGEDGSVVNKSFLSAIVTNLEAGIFNSISDSEPVIHWDTAIGAMLWGPGGSSAVDLALLRETSTRFRFTDAAGSNDRDIRARDIYAGANKAVESDAGGPIGRFSGGLVLPVGTDAWVT